MADFDAVWQRLCDHAGETFVLSRGDRFSYAVAADGLMVTGLRAPIHLLALRDAVQRVPLASHLDVQDLWGPSYLYALLSDQRIRGEDW